MKNKRNIIKKLMGIALGLILFLSGCANAQKPLDTDGEQNDSTFSIKFIDVGQADAALVQCDGHYMLIDGGKTEDSSLIYSVLKNEEVKKLDIVVGSHKDADHVGGLAGALNYAEADLVLCSSMTGDTDAFGNFKKYAELKGNGIVVPNAGDEYRLGSAKVKILGIMAEDEEIGSNDSSIILKITYGNTSFLFTGDIQETGEKTVLSSSFADLLDCDVLKVAHHGSEYSTSEAFLKAVSPKAAVISVGADNTYGHPSDGLLERLAQAGVTVYRTDKQGSIICTSNGESLTFMTDNSPRSLNENNGDYILNVKSFVFHYPTCKCVDDMSEKNKEYFTGSRQEVIERGFRPCGQCKP